jgi:hypothetical protein
MSNEAPAAETYEKVTITVPRTTLEAIDRLATADRRSRSNFIVLAMEGVIAATDPSEPARLPDGLPPGCTHREPILDRVR